MRIPKFVRMKLRTPADLSEVATYPFRTTPLRALQGPCDLWVSTERPGAAAPAGVAGGWAFVLTGPSGLPYLGRYTYIHVYIYIYIYTCIMYTNV